MGKRFEVVHQLENTLLIQLSSSPQGVIVSECCPRHLCSHCFEIHSLILILEWS